MGWVVLGIVVLFLILILPSIHMIGPTQVGLVMKRFAFKKLSEDNPIAFDGEAGYQADLLMPGLRFKFWLVYTVEKYPWVQVPAGEIGVVIAQVGAAAADRRQVGGLQDGVRQLHRPAQRSSPTAGRRACSGRCCLRAPWSRSTPSPSW